MEFKLNNEIYPVDIFFDLRADAFDKDEFALGFFKIAILISNWQKVTHGIFPT